MGTLLFVLTLLFWYFRIFSGTNPTVEIGPVDLYIEVVPMAEYGFGALRSGRLPLWNPYQLCGEPFLAMAYVGLLYPPHLINLVIDVLTGVEVLFVAHMLFGGLGMWWLARHFGLGILGALCAAVTFMWSGWMGHNNILPPIFEQLTWMPLTVLLFDLVLAGARRAWLWLILALTSQILIGAAEVFVHVLYVSGLFILCRLGQLAWQGAWGVALRRGALAAACVAAAVLLAMPQLLPAIELTRQSTRAAGTLTLGQVLGFGGAIPPYVFARAAVQTTGVVTVGALAMLAAPLALGLQRDRIVWFAALALAVGAALLVFGGPVFRLYYALPVVGSMFRRPMKFVSIYAFAQALLVGAAVERLLSWSDIRPRKLWLRPGWVASIALGVGGLAWLVSLDKMNWYWAAVLALLVLFGAVPRPRLRVGIVVGLCVLQGANLFLMVGDTHVRPMKRPEIFHSNWVLLQSLKALAGDGRVYLSPRFLFHPGLTAKQGMLREMAVSVDYEPLAAARYREFFDAVSTRADLAPFAGGYVLGPDSRWRLMDLTGTRYFVMQRGEPGDVHMAQNRADFRLAHARGQVRVFERKRVLPRAYFVTRARALAGPNEVLAALDSPHFDPHAEVLLEEPAEGLSVDATTREAGAVTITSYEPERVVISARVATAGYLVLGDFFYPGWKAFVGDREVLIERANFLFRAVRLDPGSAEVRFEYRPASFRNGVMLSAASALAILVTYLRTRRREVGAAGR